MQLYAGQYYRHVEAFPGHLRVLAARTEGALQGLIRENLAEEENPAAPHPKLWQNFAEAVHVISSSPTPTASAKFCHSFGCRAAGFSSSARFSRINPCSPPSVPAASTNRKS